MLTSFYNIEGNDKIQIFNSDNNIDKHIYMQRTYIFVKQYLPLTQ